MATLKKTLVFNTAEKYLLIIRLVSPNMPFQVLTVVLMHIDKLLFNIHNFTMHFRRVCVVVVIQLQRKIKVTK